MKNLKRILLLAFLAIGMAACSENDGPVTLSSNEVNLDMKGGTGSFTVEAPGEWYIETDGQTWYTVSPMQGSGTTEVTVTITSSEEVAPRAAVITVYGSGNSVATVAKSVKTLTVFSYQKLSSLSLAISANNVEPKFSKRKNPLSKS